MSGDIGPGDVVVCVDASPLHNSLPPLNEGGVYRVEHLIGADPSGHLGLKLVGMPTTPRGFGYRLSRFRKLNDGEDDAELIARIKGRSPVRVLA